MRMRTFSVVDHDPGWVDDFEAERLRLAEVFGAGAFIEHVGSTSVPGLAAKPIIDICAGLPSLAHAEARIDRLALLGYQYVPEYEAAIPERRYFRRPALRPRTHHLHCVVVGESIWTRHLLFRDYLRLHPEVAAEYGRLKRALAEVHARDRAGYTAAKDPFVSKVLAAAEADAPGLRELSARTLTEAGA